MKKAFLAIGLVVFFLLVLALGLMLNDRGRLEFSTLEQEIKEVQSKLSEGKTEVELRLLGDEEVVLEYGQDYTDPGAEAWLISADGSRQPLEIEPSAIDTRKLGTAEVNYSVERDGVTVASVSRTVTVQDTTPPEITLLSEPGNPDYSAFDNADGDITALVQRTEDDDRIVYTVRDSSGNEASAVRMKAPVMELVGGDSVQIPADYRFWEPGVFVMDMYGRDLSDRLEVTGDITPWKLGSYELVYSVTDDFGRTVSKTRKIEVVPAELPETVLQEKVIYLTFDDGPAEPTEALLDVLAKYEDVKVTFFVTYTDPRYVDMIGRAYREGHSIGVHAYKHDASQIYVSEEAFFDYFDKMQEIIKEQTGEYTRILRFVGGSSNSSSIAFCPGIMTALAEDLTNMGYRYYDWNIQPENADKDINLAYMTLRYGSYEFCEAGEAPPISLQHDTGGWNAFVVDRLIQWGLENGYTFKGIDLTTPEVHHPICN